MLHDRGQLAAVAHAIFSAGRRRQSNGKQEGAGICTGGQFDQFGSRNADPLGDRRIFPARTTQPAQLNSCWSGRHHDSSQRLHMLVGNLNQPACRLGTDPAYWPTVTPMEEPIC